VGTRKINNSAICNPQQGQTRKLDCWSAKTQRHTMLISRRQMRQISTYTLQNCSAACMTATTGRIFKQLNLTSAMTNILNALRMRTTILQNGKTTTKIKDPATVIKTL
jgi:hypothetical protein